MGKINARNVSVWKKDSKSPLTRQQILNHRRKVFADAIVIVDAALSLMCDSQPNLGKRED
jgi:hypothetical protein